MPFILLVSLLFVPLYVACEFHTLRGACFTFLKKACRDHRTSCVPLLQLILHTAAGGAGAGGGGGSSTAAVAVAVALDIHDSCERSCIIIIHVIIIVIVVCNIYYTVIAESYKLDINVHIVLRIINSC